MHNESLRSLFHSNNEASASELLSPRSGGFMFQPFTQERDSVGRLISNSQQNILHNISGVGSPKKYSLTSRNRSGSGHNYFGGLKDFSQLPHPNHILEEIEEAVLLDAQKRKKKQKNLVGQVHDDIMKEMKIQPTLQGQLSNKSDIKNQKQPPANFQLDKDNHFNIKISSSTKRERPVLHSLGVPSQLLVSIESSRHSINQSYQHSLLKDISQIQPLNRRSIKTLHNGSQEQSSSQKRLLVNHRGPATMPCIGLYDISNKDKFTLKKTPIVILPSRDVEEAHIKKQLVEAMKEKTEKNKVFEFYQQQKQEEQQRFIESLSPKDDIQIIFPRIKQNNKYIMEEVKNMMNRDKLILKDLDENEDFPQEFTDKLAILKAKAKRIRETIVTWGDKKIEPNAKKYISKKTIVEVLE